MLLKRGNEVEVDVGGAVSGGQLYRDDVYVEVEVNVGDGVDVEAGIAVDEGVQGAELEKIDVAEVELRIVRILTFSGVTHCLAVKSLACCIHLIEVTTHLNKATPPPLSTLLKQPLTRYTSKTCMIHLWLLIHTPRISGNCDEPPSLAQRKERTITFRVASSGRGIGMVSACGLGTGDFVGCSWFFDFDSGDTDEMVFVGVPAGVESSKPFDLWVGIGVPIRLALSSTIISLSPGPSKKPPLVYLEP